MGAVGIGHIKVQSLSVSFQIVLVIDMQKIDVGLDQM